MDGWMDHVPAYGVSAALEGIRGKGRSQRSGKGEGPGDMVMDRVCRLAPAALICTTLVAELRRSGCSITFMERRL